MTETFDREAIQRVRAFLTYNERQEHMLPWKEATTFLAHYDAMVAALREARACLLDPGATWDDRKEVALEISKALEPFDG